MNHDSYSADYIRQVLQDVKTIALVGASANTVRPSYLVTKYLIEKGYTVHPVNPGLAGQDLLGQKVYATLADIPGDNRHGRYIPQRRRGRRHRGRGSCLAREDPKSSGCSFRSAMTPPLRWRRPLASASS
jgi:hypothetical protein